LRQHTEGSIARSHDVTNLYGLCIYDRLPFKLISKIQNDTHSQLLAKIFLPADVILGTNCLKLSRDPKTMAVEMSGGFTDTVLEEPSSDNQPVECVRNYLFEEW
jgi:hypothetical protein